MWFNRIYSLSTHSVHTILWSEEFQRVTLRSRAEGECGECEGVVVVGEEEVSDVKSCERSEERLELRAVDGAVESENELVLIYDSILVFHWRRLP